MIDTSPAPVIRDPAAVRFRCLLSYHYYKTGDLSELAATRVNGQPPDVFADSGAYSAWSQGVAIDLDDYCRWLERWGDLFTTYANLDVIGDPDLSMVNQERMEARGFNPLPVFHGGEPWAVLEALCKRYPYVGLGGITWLPPAKKMPWLVKCFQVGAPFGTRFHGFGVTTLRAIMSLPFYTVDSSSWGSGFRYGSVKVWDPSTRTMPTFMVGTPEAARYGRLIRSYGFDPQDFEDRERYTRTAAVGLAALSWAALEEYLRRRNGPALCAYLAAGTPEEADPRLYLAETGSPANPMKIAAALRVYLADGSLQNLTDAAAARVQREEASSEA